MARILDVIKSWVRAEMPVSDAQPLTWQEDHAAFLDSLSPEEREEYDEAERENQEGYALMMAEQERDNLDAEPDMDEMSPEEEFALLTARYEAEHARREEKCTRESDELEELTPQEEFERQAAYHEAEHVRTEEAYRQESTADEGRFEM